MAVLDTSFVVDILRKRLDAVAVLETLSHETLYISTPTVMELWEGALRSTVSPAETRKVEEFLSTMNIADFDVRAAMRAGELIVQLAHNMIEPEDIMIAATALVRGEMVVTHDEHYTRIPGLKVLKY